MFTRTKRNANEERLDEAGEDLVRAAQASEDEIDAAAGGPLLYSRIRASIASRQRELESTTGSWLGFVRAARLAVPAMALVTAVVTVVPRLSLNSRMHDRAAATYSVETQARGEPGILVFAASVCALSSNEECAISNNELLATLFADDNQETQR